MPNWCQNSIVIPTHAVKNFKRKFCSQTLDQSTGRHLCQLDFNRIIRQPVGVLKGSIGFDGRQKNPLNWYNWNCENWGTKWNASHTNFHDQENGLTQITFDTAWTPPADELLCRIVSRLRVECVEHSWLEEAVGLCGLNEYKLAATLDGGPFVVSGIFKDEASLSNDEYQYVVEGFYGDSEYADELVSRRNGTWIEDFLDHAPECESAA